MNYDCIRLINLRMAPENKVPSEDSEDLTPDQLGKISGGARGLSSKKSLSKRVDNKSIDEDINLIGDSNVF